MKRGTPRCSTEASREEEQCGGGRDTSGSIPARSIPPRSLQQQPLCRGWAQRSFPLPGWGGQAEFWVPPCLTVLQSPRGGQLCPGPGLPSPAMYLFCAPTRTQVGHAKLVRGESHLLLYKGFLMTGSCNASLLSLSIPGALAGGCWCHPKQGTRMPRVQPLPPKHTGTTLGF